MQSVRNVSKQFGIDGTEKLQFRNREDMEDTRGLLLDRPVCSFTAGLYTSKLLLV